MDPSAVAAGDSHTCALDRNGVTCWGDSSHGKLTIPEALRLGGADSVDIDIETASLAFLRPGWDRFHFSAELRLGEGSDGVDPETEDVTISFGTYAETLPAEVFVCTGPDCAYESWGSGITRATISDGFLEVEARHVDLSGTANGVDIFVEIGNESGDVVAALSGTLASCGLGFELAFLLPPLMWLRGRRRRARG